MPFLTQPPDPHPRRPKLKLPPGSVDCHIHLFGPATRYRFHPNTKYTTADALPETYFALQETVGLSRAVLVSGGGYGTDMTHLVDVLSRFGDRMKGVALLDPDVTDARMDELGRLGVRGIRFSTAGHGGALPRLNETTATRAHERGWHVQFYPHGPELPDFADRLLALPNTIVLDHFASVGSMESPAFATLLRMLDTGRVWVKLSGPMRCTMEEPPYPSMTPIARALVKHAPERLVWGSDWPHVNMNDRTMPNDGDLVDLIAEWIPDEAARQRILVENPKQLYGFA